MFSVFNANNAYGTAVNGALLISIKLEQPSFTLKSTFKFFGKELQAISSKELAYPPVLSSVPIIRFTIPTSSVVVVKISSYSNEFNSSINENFKQMFLFERGTWVLLYPGNS